MDTAEKLIPGIDTKIVLDELYYTVKGAMKKLNFGRNKILGFVDDGSLETYIHGNEYLFSSGALLACIKKHTVKINAQAKTTEIDYFIKPNHI